MTSFEPSRNESVVLPEEFEFDGVLQHLQSYDVPDAEQLALDAESVFMTASEVGGDLTVVQSMIDSNEGMTPERFDSAVAVLGKLGTIDYDGAPAQKRTVSAHHKGRYVTREFPRHWRSDAACKDEDTEIFFQSDTPELNEEAKKFCRACDVSATCLEFALDMRLTEGVWGNTSESERKLILASREKKK